MYRCIIHKIKLKENVKNEKIIPYIRNQIKTFWGFSSISSKMRKNKTYNLRKNIQKEINVGTIFCLYGDIWGYDLSLFKDTEEELILLEPEQKFLITDLARPAKNDGIINLRCKYQDTPTILNILIKPDGIIIKYRINKFYIVKIFGKEFVEKNKNICKIMVSGSQKEYKLSESFEVDTNQEELYRNSFKRNLRYYRYELYVF